MKQTSTKTKWLLLLACIVPTCFSVTAQNVFPTTGNVGIGTLSPAAALEVTNDILVQGIRFGTGGIPGTPALYGGTCVGENALINANGYASFNTAFGSNALRSLVDGYDNTAIGNSALYGNGTGSTGNTATGSVSMEYSSGNYNAAYGFRSLNVSYGSNNCAFGRNALGRSGGSDNVSVGVNSMRGYTEFDPTSDGSRNTAIGTGTLLKYTISSENTAVGFNAMTNTTEGSENAALGNYAMRNNTTGFNNVACGRYALSTNTIGSLNSAVGDRALSYNITGTKNTAVGYFATPNTSALTNTTCLGQFARATASNQVRIGNNAVSSIGGYVNWTNISDGRVKKNIRKNVPGLDFINQLEPVTYNLSLTAADKIINNGIAKDKEGELADDEDKSAAAAKEKIVYTGFIAQDVEKAAKSLNYDFSGVDVPANSNSLYGIRYSEFVMPLVKAVQELSAENEQLKKDMAEIKAMLKNQNITATLSSASLDQNIPNPFTNNTIINYNLPLQQTAAKIIISNSEGKIMKTLDISGTGKGSITLNTNSLSAGTYQYSLYANNKLVDTKKMIVTK
jgi:trimeric autotransporter adhesin